ncbi:MAG: amidohydrolase [Chitinophagales bacterium]|nr:amidohydrolase [Chitinophagales bacterium]MDW8272894.1 amidohydrolase [Chitinophagales bacterium]
MQAELRITLVQTTIIWENISANLQHLSKLVEHVEAGTTDLIVLPEMFSTGFSMNTLLAETYDGLSVQWMKKEAAIHQCAICGSLMIKENADVYNRFFWVYPDGSIKTYDKRHLFSLSKEPELFKAGNRRLLVEWKGWKILPIICYDLRFPVWCRNVEHYDILLAVANWPERRISAWHKLLPARAIENQCYVVAVNRVGEDGNGIMHCGGSSVYDPLGEKVYYAPDYKESVQTISLSSATLKEIRLKFPFLKDADNFHIEIK